MMVSTLAYCINQVPAVCRRRHLSPRTEETLPVLDFGIHPVSR